MKTYKRIVAVMFVLALILPAMSVGAQGVRSAIFTLPPLLPNPVAVGGEIVFDLDLSIANIEPGLSGVDIYLEYDGTKVAFAEVLPDFFGASSVRVNELVTCPDGVGTCVHLVLAGTPQVTKESMLARLSFKAMAGGDTCFSVVKSDLVDANGFQVEHTFPAPQCMAIVPPDPKMTGVVSKQGAPANPNPGGGTLSCSSVTVNGVSFKTDDTGKFLVNDMPLPAGTYALRAIYPGYLASEKTITITAGSVSLIDVGTTTLRGGDVNSDSQINILDVGLITGKFGQTGLAVGSVFLDCSVTDEPADINDDGQINISDLAITAGNWSASTTVWP